MAGDLPGGLVRIPDLDAAWATARSGTRLSALRAGAERLHDRLASGPRVVSVRTFDQATLLYPTQYAFGGVATATAPYVLMTHRALLVQFLSRGRLTTLLFNPSDVVAARKTPYFQRTVDLVGETLAFSVLTTTFEPLESQLARVGVAPADVDWVAFDHFHTQDLRSLLGTRDGTYLSRFPNARLLAPRREWDDWDDLHPVQRPWFIAEGKLGVPEDRVVLTDGDLELGDGVWLLRTPGHTTGNQTLFVHTTSGIWGCSENGTSADNWSPHESRIGGLRAHARSQDVDVVLNANTPEWMADQYSSMVLERTLVDRLRDAPAVTQMFPSSEVTKSLLAPGIAPTWTHRAITSGDVIARG